MGNIFLGSTFQGEAKQKALKVPPGKEEMADNDQMILC